MHDIELETPAEQPPKSPAGGSRTAGQVVPLMAGVIVLVAALGLGLATLGAQAVGRARAQSAADATVLAAALQPTRLAAEHVAAQVATANDADLADVRLVGTTVVVRVRLGSHAATAAARVAPE